MSEEKIKDMEIENLEKQVLESAVTDELIEEEIKKEKEDFGQATQVSDKKKFFFSKKVCKQVEESAIDYKNVDLIKRFTMPSGRILPRRISGNCARHQKLIAREIKKARIIALLPFLDR